MKQGMKELTISEEPRYQQAAPLPPPPEANVSVTSSSTWDHVSGLLPLGQAAGVTSQSEPSSLLASAAAMCCTVCSSMVDVETGQQSRQTLWEFPSSDLSHLGHV